MDAAPRRGRGARPVQEYGAVHQVKGPGYLDVQVTIENEGLVDVDQTIARVNGPIPVEGDTLSPVPVNCFDKGHHLKRFRPRYRIQQHRWKVL